MICPEARQIHVRATSASTQSVCIGIKKPGQGKETPNLKRPSYKPFAIVDAPPRCQTNKSRLTSSGIQTENRPLRSLRFFLSSFSLLWPTFYFPLHKFICCHLLALQAMD